MTFTLILALSFIPALAFFAYAVRSKTLTAAFGLSGIARGLLAVAAVVFVSMPDSFIPAAMVPFETALAEEAAKLLAVSLPVYLALRKKEGTTVSARNIMTDALLVGLSFAAFESAWYALSSSSPVGLLALRTFSALPVHAAAALVGSNAAILLGAGKKVKLAGFLTAVIAHGSYTFCMERGGLFLIPGFAVVLALTSYAFYVWSREQERG